jgi:hypothetical protein
VVDQILANAWIIDSWVDAKTTEIIGTANA